MKIKLICIACLLACPLSLAEEVIDDRKKEVIDEILEVTGSLETAYSMADYMSEAMTASLKSSNTEWPDRVFDIIREEILSVISTDLENGGLNELNYPIYDQYFSREDLEAIAAFYRTDAGSKCAAAIPRIAVDSIAASEIWGKRVAAKAMQRVCARLEEEGSQRDTILAGCR